MAYWKARAQIIVKVNTKWITPLTLIDWANKTIELLAHVSDLTCDEWVQKQKLGAKQVILLLALTQLYSQKK